MIVLDGKKTSEKRLGLLKQKVAEIMKQKKSVPGLAVIRVGDDPASKIYVSKKVKTCREIGFHSLEILCEATISETDLIEKIQSLNKDASVHGILLQLPLPKHLSESKLLKTIDPSKDVDGFHPLNRGRFMAGESAFIPCTPLGVMHLLSEYKIDCTGKFAVVIGRSLIVGRPMSLLLDQAGATVAVAHSKTKNLEELLQMADIVVAAIGKPHFLKNQKLKENAVVIDVGINRLESGKIVGDVDFESYKDRVYAMTPVPGGVGPMTIYTLLENTLRSFDQSQAEAAY